MRRKKSRTLSFALSIILAFSMIFVSVGCGSHADISEDADTQKQLDSELGAFEITSAQRDLAADNEAGLETLDAGRGNPNWINTQSRYAFSRLMDFATSESERTMNIDNMGGQAEKDGIGERFDAAMNTGDSAGKFLYTAVEYCVNNLDMDKDDLVKELVDGITGDYYPSPGRCLENTEKILNAYLQSTLYNGNNLSESTKVFPTEGGTAAICYIFNALHHNRILNEGDKIAIAEPIFTPYLQIPDVNNYGLVSIDITSKARDNWDIPEDAFAKLEDPDVKAFFLVNPSNPASHQLSSDSLNRLKQVVKKNPDLIIITDDVYGTFVNNFETVYASVPENTLLVYSFSKLYGVTGWRVGLIAMNENNVVDRLLSELPAEDREFLQSEYSIVTDDPESMPFVERMVADSRSIGLYHTSGLSTPQQIFMDMLALTHLVCEDNDPYIDLSKQIVRERHEALYKALNLKDDSDNNDAEYYALLKVHRIAQKHYGRDFADWMTANVDNLTFLNDLASQYGVVLMYGPGFNGPDDTVRVSLANLDEEDYVEIANRIFRLMDSYYEQYKSD